MVGQSGGTGFSNPWTRPSGSGFASDTIGSGSLTSGSLTTSGGRASIGPRLSFGNTSFLFRTLNSPIGADDSTAYFSVLMQPEGTLGQGMFGGFFGIQFDGTVNPDLVTGWPGDVSLAYGMDQIGGVGRVSSTVFPVVGTPTLLVIKMEFLNGNDRFTLYVNPTSSTEPGTGLIKTDNDAGLIRHIALQSGGAFGVDELRLGTSFADVVPGLTSVPEPEHWAMLTGVALLAIGCGRRWLPLQRSE